MKITKNVPLLLLLVVLLTSQARAQQPNLSFRHYSSKEGLSSTTVYDIIKDSFGFIWLATEDGLNRFDGTHFKVYRHDPARADGLLVNYITSLFESRNGIIWIGTNGGGLSYYDSRKDSIFHFKAFRQPQKVVAVTSIRGDKKGNIWITGYGNLYIIDPETKELVIGSTYTPLLNEMKDKVSICSFEDSKGNIWVGTNRGLYFFQPSTGKIKKFTPDPNRSNSIVNHSITRIAEDHNGNIWIATDGGLSKLQGIQDNFTNFRQGSPEIPLSSNTVVTLKVDAHNRIWIGTDEGLDVHDIPAGTTTSHVPDDRNPRSLSSRSIRSILVDDQGIYWIGTYRGGLNKHDENFHYFNLKEYNAFDPYGLRSPIVTSFAGHDNTVFTGTDGGGLQLYDRETGLMKYIPLPIRVKKQQHDLSILTLIMGRDKRLWVGTYMNGLYAYDPATGTHKHYTRGTGPSDLNNNDIFCLKEDRKGKIWVGTNGGGVNILDPTTNIIEKFVHDPVKAKDPASPAGNFIRVIEEDIQGRIWIGTFGGGISVVQPDGRKTVYYTKENSGLPSDYVLSIMEDAKGNIWVGTNGNGIGLLKKGAKRFESLTEKDGLHNGMVHKTVEDGSGKIWISTNSGLSVFDPTNNTFKKYSVNDGLQAGAFMPGAGFRTQDGELFFGGQNGFNHFKPSELKANQNIPRIVLTDLRVDNKQVIPSDEGPISTHILLAEEINLRYKQSFSLDFEALDFTVPEANKYEYRLEGVDKEWVTAGREHSAYYANIPPGSYEFKVKASNNDGVWNDEGKTILINVAPPFWKTIYAYIAYILLALAIVVFLRHLGIRKLQMRFALEQERRTARETIERERKEAEYLHKLDQVKIKFLTNLSHEFRTPISLIMGPVDQLIEQSKEESSMSKLNLIKRNARRLFNLVNQLLDFRKMEEQELRLQYSEGDIATFLKDVCDSFTDLAKRKKIHFSFQTKIHSLPGMFDHDKIERILFNLLSNAFKFTPENGEIIVSMKEQEATDQNGFTVVAVSVKDSGIGIPMEAQEKIFQSFFQHNNEAQTLNYGTGIGLAITKEFVTLHGGTISVESEPGKGSTFLFHFKIKKSGKPIVNAAPIPIIEHQPEIPAASPAPNGLSRQQQPVLLIVEDDDDFRFYIKENLKSNYRIIEASNGEEGWKHILSYHPDIVVSDVQMPVMNGLQLALQIKSNKRTKHIPIILLTAANTPNAVLEGLASGAIDYMTKPFDFAVLQAKILNILLLNQSFKDTYSKKLTVHLPETEIVSEKEGFLQKALEYIYENLNNSQLSVETLSAHLCISRASLYNKLQEYTDQSPVEFIRTVKLEKAVDLLLKTDKTVTEVAYETGFNNANYFTKVFRSRYNMTPSEFRADKKKS